MSNNLELYEAVRSVPESAKKQIKGGRLNGMTDINPMWRIKTLTEQFGPAGIGWYSEIYNKEVYPVGDEIMVSVDVLLYIKYNGEWSMGIPGTGGSKLCSKESKGLFVDDEAFKKAETDALSVCCKKLGIGADVYWAKDGETKYSKPAEAPQETGFEVCADCGNLVKPATSKSGKFIPRKQVIDESQKKYGRILCADCMLKLKDEGAN